MAASSVYLVLSLLSGIMSVLLFIFSIFVERNKKRVKVFLVWAVMFLAASFAAAEYSLWLEGIYLFDILNFNFPIISFFLIWFGFIVWIFEKNGGRKIWIVMMIAIIILIIAAMLCPNCTQF